MVLLRNFNFMTDQPSSPKKASLPRELKRKEGERSLLFPWTNVQTLRTITGFAHTDHKRWASLALEMELDFPKENEPLASRSQLPR